MNIWKAGVKLDHAAIYMQFCVLYCSSLENTHNALLCFVYSTSCTSVHHVPKHNVVSQFLSVPVWQGHAVTRHHCCLTAPESLFQSWSWVSVCVECVRKIMFRPPLREKNLLVGSLHKALEPGWTREREDRREEEKRGKKGWAKHNKQMSNPVSCFVKHSQLIATLSRLR